MVGADASMPFTNSGPNPHANTATAVANSGRLLRRCCTVMPGSLTPPPRSPHPTSVLMTRQIRGYVLAMIQIPSGTRVYGIQLPIQSKSKTFVADWELSATPADLARVTQTADEHGYFYVAVCDHIAIPESLGSTMGTYWQDCITTLSWLGGADRTHRAAVPRVRAPLPTPAGGCEGNSRPSTTSPVAAPSSGSAPVTWRRSSRYWASTTRGAASSSRRSSRC